MLSRDTERFRYEIIDTINNDYDEFIGYQTDAFNTLALFHKICEKNKIDYYLAFGSLLGAIRNGGQIPRDYDIDVMVPVEQREKLIDALDRELPKEYHYLTRFKDKKYRTYTLKLCPRKYDPEVVHVDVFWLFGSNGNNTKKKCKKINRIMLYKFTEKKYFGVQGKVSNLYYWYNKVKASLWPAFLLDWKHKRIYKDSFVANKNVQTIGGDILNKKWFETKERVRMENGYEFYIPGGYKELLTLYYGDYMRMPSVESRMSEMATALHRIRTLHDFSNAEEKSPNK